MSKTILLESERTGIPRRTPASPTAIMGEAIALPPTHERGGRSGRRQRLLPRHLLVYASRTKPAIPGRRQKQFLQLTAQLRPPPFT